MFDFPSNSSSSSNDESSSSFNDGNNGNNRQKSYLCSNGSISSTNSIKKSERPSTLTKNPEENKMKKSYHDKATIAVM